MACFTGTASNAAPKSQSPSPCRRMPTVELITVAIAADDAITADGRSIPLQGLHKYFQDLAATRPNTAVNIMPDANSHYGIVLQVVDAAKTAGLHPQRIIFLASWLENRASSLP